ncbi:MAG: F0F1 ATP synthase subunit B [Coriobacteriia bacterium]|nr:F0F1 ATP synthase subunit B [Coriobacteriia bacterium]
MKYKIGLVFAAFCLMIMPASAYAAGDILASPIVPTMTEFIPMLIAFAIVAFVLIKVVWPKILPVLDARAEKIENSLKTAEEAKLESENLLAEVKAKVEERRKEAAQITDDARANANEQRDKIIADAKTEAKSIVDAAKVAADTMKRDAAADIQKQTAQAAVAIAAKFIGGQLDASQASGLTSKYFAEMGSFNDN